MRNFSLRTFSTTIMVAFLALGMSVSAQTLNYVPVIGTYAGGTATSCAAATDGYGDGCPATQAILSNPWMTTSDAQGNLYFSDLVNNIVRRVDAKMGIITLVAGGATTVCAAKTDTVGDGCSATQAILKAPQGVRFDLNGNLLIADGGNNRVRSIDKTTGIITTIAGTGTTATTPPSNTSPKAATATNIGNPFGLAIDSMGNLYMACGAQSAVLMMMASNGKLVPGTSVMYTIAGTGTRGHTGDGGPGPQAQLYQDRGVYIGADGTIYIGDQNNAVVRKVTSPFAGGTFNVAGTTITTIAGTGTLGYTGDGGQATAAQMDVPEDVFLDNANHLIAVGYGATIAAGGDYIRQIDLTTGIISTIAGIGTRVTSGDGGPALSAGVQGPQGGNYDRFGNIFLGSCPTCNVVRRISLDNYFLPAQAVNGTSASQNVIVQANASTTLAAVSITPATGAEFVLGQLSGCSVGAVLAQSAYCTLPVSFSPSYPGLRTGRLVSKDASSASSSLGLWGTGVSSMPIFGGSVLSTVAGTGTAGVAGEGATAASAPLNTPGAGVVDSQGNIYFADTGNNAIRRIDAATGKITTVAGNGTSGYSGDGAAATAALLKAPAGVALDAAGNLYISDTGNNVIRFVNVDTGLISTIAGNGTSAYAGDGGLAKAAEFNQPQGLLVDAGGNVYVADTGNSVIRKFATSGPITTFAGTGTVGASGDGGPAVMAQLNRPTSIAFDGNASMYVADSGNGLVRKIDYLGQMSTVAGTAGSSTGNSGDGAAATAASLSNPSSVAVDAGGDLYIASGNVVRIVDASGLINTFAGTGSGAYSGEGGSATGATLGSSNLALMLDSAANLYIASPSANRLLEVKSSSLRALDFGVQAPGTQGPPVVIPVRNAGNSALTLSGLATSTNFTLDAATADDCTATTTLAPGGGCLLKVSFTPSLSAQGSVTGTVVLTDNALNVAGATQTLQLTGSTHLVAATSTTLNITPASPVYGSAATAVATIANGSAPSGTVSFSVNGTTVGTANVSSGAASIALPILPAGIASVSVTYSGDANNKSSSAAVNATIAPAILTVTAGNATVQQGQQNPAFTYTITGFVNGDTSATAVSGAPAFTTTATTTSAQGTYPITPATGTLVAANYTFKFVNGTLTVGPPPPPDFTLTVSSTTPTVTDGQTIQTTISLTSLYNYTGQVKLSCTGLPKNVICYFGSGTLTGTPSATNATVSTTLTIATDTVTRVSAVDRQGPMLAVFGAPALFLLGLGLGRRRRLGSLLMLAAFFIVAAGLSGCGGKLGSSVAVPGTYSVTVTAVDGSLSKSVPLTLTIN